MAKKEKPDKSQLPKKIAENETQSKSSENTKLELADDFIDALESGAYKLQDVSRSMITFYSKEEIPNLEELPNGSHVKQVALNRGFKVYHDYSTSHDIIEVP